MIKDGIQNTSPKKVFTAEEYDPAPIVQKPYPVEEVVFSFSGAYSLYNWELFYHIPVLIATRLSQNQKFEEARRWFHYIFDPTRPSASVSNGSERFWLTKPFKKEIADGILTIEALINSEGNSAELDAQLNYWERNPFNPHAVARLRHAAYMRTTVMKYIDNLIAWGDQLFRRDTIESINEATQIYILAANMLGKKPENIPPRAKPEEKAFSSIQKELDSFSNAKVEVQSFIAHSGIADPESTSGAIPPISLFCTPKNDQLLKYWDTVADRLFKIRHCMNIQGVVRQLPLFEPPIDPALLIRATALGLDLNAVLNDVNAMLPNYRFQVMLQKANEICMDVKNLGSQLLSVLEKRDAEELSLIRSSQELKLLELVRDIKESQVEEAKTNLESLNAGRRVVEERLNYYSTRPYKNERESEHIVSLNRASILQDIQGGNEIVASVLFGLPKVKIGAWSWGTETGGDHLAGVSKSISASLGALASHIMTRGNIASIEGSYQRRMDDWKFQSKSAELELKQLDKQILASEIRLAIAEKDLENHDVQIENAKAIDDYLRSKFTNEELYDYMIGQVSAVYFQSYQLAYETAKKAEKCFQHELGEENTAFIQFGYWDSLKKGLLSGEKLQYDLRRLELAYLDRNKREFEMTKHISLKQLNPLALLKLKAYGECEVMLPEWLFDLDCPGHYMRRLKNVGLSIPAIAGPYTSINCTLTLEKSTVRKSKSLLNVDGNDEYGRQESEEDRFIDYTGPVQSIVTSSAQNDTGQFEVNLRDERYLPFEGFGAESTWKLELPSNLRQFDYNTITDVILHVRYTARPGGDDFRAKAAKFTERLIEEISTPGLFQLFSLQHDFPNEWHQFLNSTADFKIRLTKENFPYLVQGKDLVFNRIELISLPGLASKVIPSVDFTNRGVEISIAEDEFLKRDNNANVFLIIGYSVK